MNRARRRRMYVFALKISLCVSIVAPRRGVIDRGHPCPVGGSLYREVNKNDLLGGQF